MTTTAAATQTTTVRLLPDESENLPRASEPQTMPAMNRLMVSGESQARSQTSCHSETTVDSEDESGKVTLRHPEDRPGEDGWHRGVGEKRKIKKIGAKPC